MNTQSCPGCKLELPESVGPVHPYMVSSPGCWEMYGEVLAREYSNPEYMTAHRLTVDAYALQHPGSECPRSIQSVAVHLISLYAVLERKLPHRHATALIGRSVDTLKFVWLEPPRTRSILTVASIVSASTAQEHCSQVRKWTEDVWESWSPHHTQVENWVGELRSI